MKIDDKLIQKVTTGLRVITGNLCKHLGELSAGISDFSLARSTVCLIITSAFASSVLAGCSPPPREPVMQSEVHGSPTASVPGLFNSPVAQVAQQQTSTERPVSATPAVLQSKKISQVIVGRIDQSITKGVPVVEIENPKLAFPAGIYVDQIDKYFKIDNILLALVYRPSHNLFGFPLTPEHYTFAGILAAEQGEKKWSKLAEIKELNGSIGEYVNNPYYLMVKDLQLRLSVVDDNGGGSGEGYLKVFALSETGDWQQLEQCYYFGLGVEGDYLAFSTQLAKHKPEPMDSCKDVTMISI